MTRPAPKDDPARREIARLLATWGVEEDPATSEIAAVLEGSLEERARRAAATTPPPVPEPAPKATAPPPTPQPPAASVPTSTPAAKATAPKAAPAAPPKPKPAPAPAPAPKPAPAPAPAVKAVEPDAASPSARQVFVTRSQPRSKPRRHTPLRAWVFLLTPVMLAGLVLVALAAWNAGPATAEVLIGLEQESPRAMELLLVSPDGSLSEVATFDEGVQQLRLDLPHGSYELYLDGRFTGVRISVPMQTQTALPVPPERGARPGAANALQREPPREREDE